VPLVDISLYVMTPEFGAASQLEKIDMLDLADFVAINKFDRKGAEDALRDVRKHTSAIGVFFNARRPVAGLRHPSEPVQRRRHHGAVSGAGRLVADQGLEGPQRATPKVAVRASSHLRATVPPDRRAICRNRARCARLPRHVAQQARSARERAVAQDREGIVSKDSRPTSISTKLIARKGAELTAGASKLLEQWPTTRSLYAADEYVVRSGTRKSARASSANRYPAAGSPRWRCRSRR